MVNVQLLSDAITALEMVTKGRKPESLHALAAGFGLDCLSHEEALGELLSKHLAEAARGLFRISRGESWRLRPKDRARLTDLVATVREVIELTSRKPTRLH
jgi:hypothetical protein